VNLLVFGFGYTSDALARRERGRFERIAGTVRARDRAEALGTRGVTGRVFGPDHADAALTGDIEGATHLLVSIPPETAGDPVLRAFEAALAAAPGLAWIGYLSTIGVYGDAGGGWVDETTPPDPKDTRAAGRIAAEAAWLALGERTGKAVQVFRLGGIYGPGRNALVNLREGSARRIVKPGQVFNRIHVDDIAAVVSASMDRPRAGAVYNVIDDEPAPPQDVVAYAAELMGLPVPPDIPFEEAPLSLMGRSFYSTNKRVSNRLIREELGVGLAYPTYREGLRALLQSGDGAAV
jgi:nucleoside-diphosphate-sugar epimerase